ncbi:H-NS histone family protein [Cupriavidus pampae]|uniref:H-NS histone family protein n=1 Tax=Cupriavidus pampae TaxID=659251 RepID=UPI001CC614FD|nr:H-NS histone family protein [Cupriavidus pampae]
MATYKELLAQRNLLDDQIAAVRAEEVGGAIARIQELMVQYGLTTDDIIVKRRGRKPGSKTLKPSAPTAAFQDPKTGKTWSGRGRAPSWIVGKNRERFRIAV